MDANSPSALAAFLDASSPAGGSSAAACATFQHQFEAELQRVDRLGRDPKAWEEDNLVAALGAAALGEYELAAAFLDAAARLPSAPPPRSSRYRPTPTATLRLRLMRIIAMRQEAADPAPASG